MERYFLFGGDVYYPGGGWEDYQGAFESVDAARLAAQRLELEWFHIVDPSLPSGSQFVEQWVDGHRFGD